MKKIYISILALAFVLSSCSTVKGIFGKDEASVPATNNVQGGVVDAPVVDKTNKRGSVSPAGGSTDNIKPTQEQLSGGQWTISSVGDISVNAEDDAPYINFDPQGRFYAYDGCNIINGDYVIKSDGSIVFSNTLSTMKYCPDVEYGALIDSILSPKSKLAVDCRRIGQDTYLYIKNDKGNTLATFRRHNMEFLNGNWKVTAINGAKVNSDELTLFFDIAELKIHGNTGCNFFNGQIYIDPAKSNAIDFSNMGMTRMACPDSNREQAMMVALEETASAIAGKKENTALLLSKAGKELLQLKKIANSESGE